MSKLAKILALDEVDLEEKVRVLIETLKTELKELPRENTRTIRKVKRWLNQLDYVTKGLKKITSKLMKQLEKDLKLKLPDAELLHIAMFQPSTRNLFMEIHLYYMHKNEYPIEEADFKNLESLSDMGRVLAMIGDSAIELAVIHHLWRERTSDAGEITQQRAEIISNENMARLCDRWNLYSTRIHFDPVTTTKSEMEHIKGTLLEAVYGIVYINEGFDKIIDTVKLLM